MSSNLNFQGGVSGKSKKRLDRIKELQDRANQYNKQNKCKQILKQKACHRADDCSWQNNECVSTGTVEEPSLTDVVTERKRDV